MVSATENQETHAPEGTEEPPRSPKLATTTTTTRERPRWLRLGGGTVDAMIESVSRRAFGRSTGVYNVRASEAARERKLNLLSASVVFLDDTQQTFLIEKKAKGSVLLEQVFAHLELVEKDYFGLQFTENGVVPNATNTEITRWLDPNKSVKKQAEGSPLFWLAVRFYPPEPSRLAEEYTRYLLCLQLRRLLLDGRITAPKNTALLLASFTVQAELGDFSVEEHSASYLSEMRLLAKQTAEEERRVRELHKLHRGQAPSDAEANFLEHAKRLDGYGVDSHPAKDSNGKDIVIGVTSNGIVVFQNNIRVNTFSWAKIVKISFKRKQFFIQIKREPSETYDTHLGFNMRSSRAAKSLWRCSVEQHGFFRLQRPRAQRGVLGALGALTGLGAPQVQRTETQALEDARRAHTLHRMFVRQGSSRVSHRASMSPGKVSVAARASVVVSGRGGHARVTTQDVAPRPAWGADEPVAHSAPEPPAPIHISDDEGGFLERVIRGPLPYVDDSSSGAEEEDAGVVLGAEEAQYVTVRLAAGPDGRFGFNVRGGRGMPVLVSRVAPATPAHQAQPAIQEGDQVIAINSVEVENLCHEQVVQLIRNTRGVLTLTLRPNALYTTDEDNRTEEPAFCFVPLTETADGECDALAQSMLLLGDGLASGAALRQYDTLLRRLPDEPCVHAKMPHNLPLNRYRDIAPYDKTRVILKDSPNGDYINASYINMEIPSSDLVLTYIACQGALPTTVGDFWQMVWESDSTLVVMLTVLSERGRAKCHQYWANVDSAPLKVTSTLTLHTLSEQPSPMGHYVHREMLLKENGPGGASRQIDQLQYLAWPDHGVPEDATAFIRFTQLCSSLRTRKPLIPTVVEEMSDSPEHCTLDPPMIVHCSAGVGRTGALILAETALELLRRRQPLYPLDLVRHMRSQRPMCIQNVSQYKFVCESIQTAYSQGLFQTAVDHPPPRSSTSSTK